MYAPNLTVEYVNELLAKQGNNHKISKISAQIDPNVLTGGHRAYYVLDTINWPPATNDIRRQYIPEYPNYNNILFVWDGIVSLKYSL
jgi:hypothetical protein